ncbi:MAG: hypothetical protein ABIF82_04790 [Planctomycetota bacterium]
MAVRRKLRKLKYALLVAIVVLAALCIWAAAYVSRSPLRPGESLLTLVHFDAAFVGRCADAEGFWEKFSSLPRYREFASAPEGRAFLASAPLARAARRVNERGRILGWHALDLFDLFGEETILAGPPVNVGPGAFLCASRVPPTANLLIGICSAFRTSEPLPTSGGEWWAVVERGSGIGWTKVGDVLVASNNLGLLARFVAAARGGRREVPPLARLLPDDDRPQLAVRIRGPAEAAASDKGPRAVVIALRLGAGEPGPRDSGAAPEELAAGHIPNDICAGFSWRLEPAAAWRTALAAVSETSREHIVRYAEDHICAILDAEDFEDGVLGRFSGGCTVVVSHERDPWLSLAAGCPMPTVSLAFRIRSDRAFERRLEFALVEATGALAHGESGFTTAVSKQKYRDRGITLVQVRQRDARAAVSAGYFIAPDDAAPDWSIVIASTSVAWLRRAIDAHDGRSARLSSEEWFRGVSRGASPGPSVFAFMHGDLLARAFGRMRGRAAGSANGLAGAEQWLRLLGAVALEGPIGDNGVVRMTLRIPGRATKPARKKR